MAPELQEGVHFSIVFYGGRLLSHLSFAEQDTAVEQTLIPLIRVNRNAAVVLDSERKKKGQKLSKPRQALRKRIEKELEGTNGMVWVTQGRDIENYLSKKALDAYCSEKFEKFRLKYDSYSTLDEMIQHGDRCRTKFKYSGGKVRYCKEILPHISKSDIDTLDLKSSLTQLVEMIRVWNNMS